MNNPTSLEVHVAAPRLSTRYVQAVTRFASTSIQWLAAKHLILEVREHHKRLVLREQYVCIYA
jgi:hypothetical protein